jgi:hypothetical protein
MALDRFPGECTLHGLPAGFALTGAKADEQQVLRASSMMPSWPPCCPARRSSATRPTTTTDSEVSMDAHADRALEVVGAHPAG